jgi:hypothetical protein
MPIKTLFITSGTTSFIVPSDYGTLNFVDAIGSGGNGHVSSINPAGGGGGGGFARSTSLTFTASQTVYCNVASGGAGSSGLTWINNLANLPPTSDRGIAAVSGSNATSGTGAAGGTAAGVGSNLTAGGAGGTAYFTGSNGGGGGAAGPQNSGSQNSISNTIQPGQSGGGGWFNSGPNLGGGGGGAAAFAEGGTPAGIGGTSSGGRGGFNSPTNSQSGGSGATSTLGTHVINAVAGGGGGGGGYGNGAFSNGGSATAFTGTFYNGSTYPNTTGSGLTAGPGGGGGGSGAGPAGSGGVGGVSMYGGGGGGGYRTAGIGGNGLIVFSYNTAAISALAISGAMSLGGSTSTRSVNLRLGNSATQQIALGSTGVRTVYNVASGAIRLATDGYGK